MSFRGECASTAPASDTCPRRLARSASGWVHCPRVRSARVSAITENVLIHFDQAKSGTQDILAAAQSTLNEYSLAVFKAERTLAAQSTVQERRLQEESVGEILPRVVASAVTLGFSAMSTRKAPATLLGRFMTVPALTSSLAGLAHPAQRLALADVEAAGPMPIPSVPRPLPPVCFPGVTAPP